MSAHGPGYWIDILAIVSSHFVSFAIYKEIFSKNLTSYTVHRMMLKVPLTQLDHPKFSTESHENTMKIHEISYKITMHPRFYHQYDWFPVNFP